MPKPNYQYEKRARELAKKQKKEDKLKRRQENAAKANAADEETSPVDPSDGTSSSELPEGQS